MKPTTGTHVYKLLACRRAVALDLVGDRSRKRALREDEQFVLQRGRDHEARVVAGLGWPEPSYAPRDWASGAAATEAMLRRGIDGVCQGVLQGPDRLGIPDLLRREVGSSAFGDFHYVVGDVKSSAQPRSDQLLQVAFYSSLLTLLQDRQPQYGYLILKDGREERFELADFEPALMQVEREIEAIRADPTAVRPFYAFACDRCDWSELCLPELHAADDLSLLPGMTRALRSVLEREGVRRCADLVGVAVDRLAKRTGLESQLVRQLERAAGARGLGLPLRESVAREAPAADAIVHMLVDPFEDRVLWIGVLSPARESLGTVRDVLPRSRDEEWAAYLSLLQPLRPGTRIWHYGAGIPAWHEQHSFGRVEPLAVTIEAHFVDMAKRLRGASTPPAPVFGLADHVRVALGRDPHRCGHAAAAALHASRGDHEWLRQKGHADLADLAALKATWLDTKSTPHPTA